jgi:uncharacterized protein with PIN domain
MAVGEDATTPAQPATIWTELDAWAQDFKPWQKFVLANAVRHGSLTDQQIDQAYRLFLNDNELSEAPDPPIEVPEAITGRPAAATLTPIWLKRIDSLRAVNALREDAELVFSPSLTVVYGGNGVGKSGFTRILTNVCFSRTQHPILPNIYGEEAGEPPTANIVIEDGSQTETPFVFDGATEHAELKRIAVFDTAIARKHLTETNSLGFVPTGFDVFPEMARVYSDIAHRLAVDIDHRRRENTFKQSFVAPASPVSEFVASLGIATDIEELRNLAIFGEAESARLEEIQRQMQDLQTKSVADAIKQLNLAKRDIGALQMRLTECSAPLIDERRTAYRAELVALAEKAKKVAEQGAESFKKDFFQGIGSDEWESFITAAHALGQVEHEHYPNDDDHCLLCHQPLDAASAALIRRLWGFLASDVKREAEEASVQLDRSLDLLRQERPDFFSKETTVYEHLTRLNPELAKRVEVLVAAMERDRAEIIAVLEKGAGEIQASTFEPVDEANRALEKLTEQIDIDIARLNEQTVEDAIKALEAERISLRHRQVLNQLQPDIEQYISNLKWAERASGAPRRSLNPRPLTDKEGNLFATVIAKSYRERLASECKALECTLPLEFRTQGQRGQTVRSLSVGGGHSPDVILSEGEQRAVALADFLTEVGLNPANAGVVLDDPVTSQDHQRKELIAQRLVSEATARQVVIFTHDLVFLTMLANAANDQDVELLSHWIERDSDGRPGQISLDDSPATTPQYRNTQKAQNTFAEANHASGSERTRLIQRGMGELRRTIEEIVPHFLLKQVVNRWTDRIIVTGLKKVNWDKELVADIIQTYEDLSAFIEGHSHTEEQSGAPPEPKNLEEMISRVNDLIKRARPDAR